MAQPAKYRPYRALLWGVYLAIAFGFCGLIIVAAVGGLLRERALATATQVEPADCARELGRLYHDVHAQLVVQQAERVPAAGDAEQGWAGLRARLHALKIGCRFEAKPQTEQARRLLAAYRLVEQLQRLSEAAGTQYAQEVRPTDGEARDALATVGAPVGD